MAGPVKARPVTAATAVDLLEMLNLPAVSRATIRQWACRGKVRRYGLDQFGLQKYELRDIIIAANAEQQRRSA